MSKNMSRRDFLKISSTAMGAVILASCAPQATQQVATEVATQAPAAPKPWLGTSIRSLSNPYHASWDASGQKFAADMGLSDQYQTLLCEGDNTKQVDDIKALIAKSNGDVVFNVDPNEASNAVPIADICEKEKVYFMTHWNKPDEVKAWDYKYWVAHTAADDVGSSYQMAKNMFDKIGGKGTACHIQGMLGNTAAQGREEGFNKAVAEYPDIKVLEIAGGTWDQIMAQQLTETWLTKYDEINVIHTAGDPHALGVVAAIKAVRPEQLGKILVSGFNGDEPTTNAILAGEVYTTAGVPVGWQGQMGLSIPYHAKLGTFDPSKEPKEHRQFYFACVIVDTNNAQDWMDNNIKGVPTYDYDDLWSGVAAPMS